MARRRNGRWGNKNSGKKIRALGIRAAVISVALLLLALLAWNQCVAYLQGSSFRTWLENRLSESTGATVRLAENLAIEGSRVSQAQVDVAGLGLLQQGKAERLSMEVERAALLRRRLHINKLTMEEGTLVLLPPVTQAPAAAAPTEAEGTGSAVAVKPAKKPKKKKSTPAPAPAPQKQQSFFSLQGVQVDALECKNTDFLLYTGQTEEHYALQGTTLTAAPAADAKGEQWRISLENGHLTTPYSFLKACSLKSANLVYDGKGGVTVPECRFMLTPGEIRLQARVDAAENRWSADIAVNKANVHRLLSDDWKKKLRGELYGKLLVSAEGGSIRKGSGNLSLQQAVLEGLPFLSELSIDGTRPYRTLVLEKANCRISFPYTDKRLNITDAWLFDEIDVRSKGGALRITGHVIIGQNGELGGTLAFGIPQKYMEALTPLGVAREQIFNGRGEAGYAWVNINLSGTLDDPQEDLSVRLSTLLQQAVGQSINKGAESAVNLFNDLLQNAGKAATPAEEPGTAAPAAPATPADAAGQLIKTGLDILF